MKQESLVKKLKDSNLPGIMGIFYRYFTPIPIDFSLKHRALFQPLAGEASPITS
jgi:hypothetical protein